MNATIKLKEPDETIHLGPGAKYELMQDSDPMLIRAWDGNAGYCLFPVSRLIDARFGDHNEGKKRESANQGA